MKINFGAIFKNDKKTSDKAPDYKGKINVEGKEWSIACWVKQSQNGTSYFSCKIEEPYVKADATKPELFGDKTYTNDLPF